MRTGSSSFKLRLYGVEVKFDGSRVLFSYVLNFLLTKLGNVFTE